MEYAKKKDIDVVDLKTEFAMFISFLFCMSVKKNMR